MNTQEWTLIIFTILTEMSVGAFLVLGVVHYFINRKAGEQEADRMTDRVLIAIVVTLGLGFLASLFHLGNPLNAPKAVMNVATSWLSREILFGVIFSVVSVVFVAMQWFKKGSAALRKGIALLTALIGIVFVYIQAQVYMLEVQPSWNHFATPVGFLVTTLLLGVLANGAALVWNYAIVIRKDPGCEKRQFELLRMVVRWLAIASILLVGIEIIVIPIYLAALGTGPAMAQESLQLMTGPFNTVFILRLVLGFIGAVVLATFLYRKAVTSEKKYLGTLAISAFLLVLIAEVLGRYMFYATHVRIGI